MRRPRSPRYLWYRGLPASLPGSLLTSQERGHIIGRSTSAGERELPRRPPVPPGARLGLVDGDEAVLGITWYAQDSLGELVLYEALEVGSTLTQDKAYAEVESVKAVSDVVAPLSGEVLEVNGEVVEEPETVNEDPYGEGWLVRIRVSIRRKRTACSTPRIQGARRGAVTTR